MKFIFFLFQSSKISKIKGFFFFFFGFKEFWFVGRVGNLDFYVFDKRTLMFWM